MPQRPLPTNSDALQGARAWLELRHQRAHRQVLRLLCETPAEAISQALGQLSTGSCAPLAATSPAPPAPGSTSRHPRTPARTGDRRTVTPPGASSRPGRPLLMPNGTSRPRRRAKRA